MSEITWKTLKQHEAEKAFQSWNDEKPSASCSGEYQSIREDLVKIFNDVLENLGLEEQGSWNKQTYKVDMEFGLQLYDYLNSSSDFTLRTASSNDFWRYLSIKVIPDIVYIRSGLKSDYFYRTTRRIWLRKIWWYVHLSWQGDLETTRDTLWNNSTDEIVQLVERSGPNGYRVKLTRELMKMYGSLDDTQKTRSNSMFRSIMKLNTVKVRSIEPELHPKGEEAYARELFEYFQQKQLQSETS
ncbi:hypothetical protein [Salibacterium qingdaonense]|uniref:hypothetical protein n=1 Tax=Salibacterium qingdaonense TaxID=266892 RepID=UPI000ACE6FB1|nr:hypothetical protein [Salibacterium qingdaonense]